MDAKLLGRLKEIGPGIWELPKSYRKRMKVPVRVFATEKLLKEMDDGAIEQAINVSELPGIVDASLVMPDAHWGYGFPIGGVAAFDLEKGVISPGGIGFDINCGMRLLVTNLTEKNVRPKIEQLVDGLFSAVPSGVGHGGAVRLSGKDLSEVMVKGAAWAVENGMGWKEDLKHIEENGQIKGANPENVSDRAVKRGIGQLGTLGAGNHYLEVQKVEKVFDVKAARKMGITGEGQVTIMIHCGSRGFGHQIASDYLHVFERSLDKYNIKVSDQQLACAPFKSDEGQKYFSAMAAAANFAFCNRQVIAHNVREVFSEIYGRSAEELGINLVYDVAHNIAKVESFGVKGKRQEVKVLIHRKGATRAYPNEPVIIGGSMETGSYLLVGTESALQKTFGSTAHGSGRTMSRTKARKLVRGKQLQERMKKAGIYVKTASYSGLAEEAGSAYKDINEVVKAVSMSDISQPVASFKPLGNIKG